MERGGIPIRTPEQEELMRFCETEEFEEKYKPRYMIEAKNSELKNIYSYDKALSFGIHSMEIQGAMTIFVSNIQRILAQGGLSVAGGCRCLTKELDMIAC